jgi:hypothetical protein
MKDKAGGMKGRTMAWELNDVKLAFAGLSRFPASTSSFILSPLSFLLFHS